MYVGLQYFCFEFTVSAIIWASSHQCSLLWPKTTHFEWNKTCQESEQNRVFFQNIPCAISSKVTYVLDDPNEIWMEIVCLVHFKWRIKSLLVCVTVFIDRLISTTPYTIKFTNTHLFTWVERDTARVYCLSQEKLHACHFRWLHPQLNLTA